MASSSSNNKIMYMLTSSDGVFVEVEEAVARKSNLISRMIDDDSADKPIPLANVTENVLSKVIKYCKIHVEEGGALKKNVHEKEEVKKELQDWDTKFMKQHDMGFVFQLILAANYLEVQGLLDLTCKTVADRIKDKQPDEIRTIFNIKKDYTSEEEAEILKENEWAFH